MALHFQMHGFSPNQPRECSHRGYTSQGLWLFEHSQETASRFQLIIIAPRSIKGVQENLSLQVQHLEQTKGGFASI